VKLLSRMWRRFWRPLVIVVPSAAVVLAVLYVAYRFIDPIPPRHFAIAAGMAGSGYDNFARQYARILARNGVRLEVRNAAGAVEDLDLLRDGAMGVQEALTALGFTQPGEFMDAIAKPSFLNHAQMDPESLQIDFEWARFTYVYQKHSQSLKVKMANLHLSSCHSCNGFALWVGERLAFPTNVEKTLALVEEDVEEAATILNKSPRGATALIRVCI